MRGKVPHRLPPPQGLEVVPELEDIDGRRDEISSLRPPRHRLALRRLLLPRVLGRALALARFRRHGGWGEVKGSRTVGGSSNNKQELEEEEDGDGDAKIGESAEGK